jgi:uncharacterized membrane protein
VSSRPDDRLHFFKTTITGGLLILVPVVLLVMILAKAVEAMRMVAAPITRFLPAESVFGVAFVDLIAVLILVAMCFVAGLVAERTLIRSAVSTLESAVLMKIPGYVLVKGMLSGLEEDDTHRLYPVLVAFDDGARIGLEIERIEDGQVVVMTPSSPNPWSGEVNIMEPRRIRRLDIPLRDYVQNVQGFGRGMDELLSRGPDTGD